MDSISELELLRQKLLEAERLREESDQRAQNAVREREDEKRLREESDQRAQNAVREKEAAERLSRKTALFEYLDAIQIIR